MWPAAGHAGGIDDVAQPFGRCDEGMVTLLPFGLQAGQQAGDLAHGGPHRRQHVALEFGVIRIDLGIGQKHGELPGHVLDVMDDEGEPLAVFAKLLGLGQDLHGTLFRHSARDFATNDT